MALSRPLKSPEPDSRYATLFRRVSIGLAWLLLALAGLGFFDALLHHYRPRTHGHVWGSLPHQALSACIGFLLAGLGALSARKAPGLQVALGIAVVGIAFLSMSPDAVPAWSMDPLTGWIVLLLGFSLAAGGGRIPAIGYARQFALFAVFFLCGLAIVGYAYEAPMGQKALGDYLRIPWPSAATGLVAGHALLFQRPDFGVMRLLSGNGFGCHIMRRLLPSVILLLIALGWLISMGENHGWYPSSFGEGLYAVLAITGFSGILLFTAASLNRLNGESRERERELHRSQKQLQAILDHTSALVCLRDLGGKYLLVNRSFARAAGKDDPEQCLGKTAAEMFPRQSARAVEDNYKSILDSRNSMEAIMTLYEAGGARRTLLAANFPLLDARGEPYALCGIYTDISDIKRQEEEIRRLNESLRDKTVRQEAANSELEAFSYSVSHDLRVPLRHITGFGQLLAQRNKDNLDEKSRHYLDVIQASVGRMGALIDDLLSFSRAGKVELSPKRVSTAALVEEVRAELETHRKGPEIAWEIGPLPDTHGDPAMLRLAWVNLLSNAVKYSGKNPAPRITVSFEPAGGEPGAFSVRDNGAGFDMKYADKLFGVFQRLHSTQEYEGTGIGLAMVRRILERHGGRIWAEAAPGAGACFYFVLPESNRNTGAQGAGGEGAT